MCKIYTERPFCIYCGACQNKPQYNSWEEQYLSKEEEWLKKQIKEAYRD